MQWFDPQVSRSPTLRGSFCPILVRLTCLHSVQFWLDFHDNSCVFLVSYKRVFSHISQGWKLNKNIIFNSIKLSFQRFRKGLRAGVSTNCLLLKLHLSCCLPSKRFESDNTLIPVSVNTHWKVHKTVLNSVNMSIKSLLQGNSSKQIEDQTLERLSDELRKVEKTLSLILKTQKEEEKLGYWTRVAKRVNKYFLIFYVIVSILFLLAISIWWSFGRY